MRDNQCSAFITATTTRRNRRPSAREGSIRVHYLSPTLPGQSPLATRLCSTPTPLSPTLNVFGARINFVYLLRGEENRLRSARYGAIWPSVWELFPRRNPPKTLCRTETRFNLASSGTLCFPVSVCCIQLSFCLFALAHVIYTKLMFDNINTCKLKR